MPIAWDETNPADTASIPGYPANARAQRVALKAGIGIEHDTAEGRHKFGFGNSAARDAILTWVDGSVWFLLVGSVYIEQLYFAALGGWIYVHPPTNYAQRDAVGEWGIYQYITTVTVTPSAGSPNPIVVSGATAAAKKVTLVANSILSNPSIVTANKATTFTIEVWQDGTGGRTLVFDTSYIFQGGVVPLISSTANSMSFLTLTQRTDGKWMVNIGADYRV